MITQLRKEAVADALDKAQQFADLTGVGLGRLIFVSEGGSTSPMNQSLIDQQIASLRPLAHWRRPSVAESWTFLLNVQAVFAIQ